MIRSSSGPPHHPATDVHRGLGDGVALHRPALGLGELDPGHQHRTVGVLVQTRRHTYLASLVGQPAQCSHCASATIEVRGEWGRNSQERVFVCQGCGRKLYRSQH